VGGRAEAPDASGTGYVCDFDGFDSASLAHSFNFLRTPRTHWWSLTERPGFLRMNLRPVYLGEQAHPCFIGRRQQHMTFTVTAELEFNPDLQGQAAGLALVQSDAFHLRFAVVRKGEAINIRLVRMENGIRSIVAEAELATMEELAGKALRLVLRIEAKEQDLRFLCGLDESRLAVLAEQIDARMLSTDVAGGFVGTYAGMFAEGENPTGAVAADFDSFSYEGC
jgi:alpha-N-arabinofuranosidase